MVLIQVMPRPCDAVKWYLKWLLQPIDFYDLMNTHLASDAPEALLQAFAATEYRVGVAGADYVVHPGHEHEPLNKALGQRPWGIITAFNPHAHPIDEAANRQRHQHLLETIAKHGWEVHPAVNHDPDGNWPDETAVLIVGADIADLDALAATFGQAAIITGSSGEPARLRLYGKQWPQTRPDWTRQVN